MNNTEQNIMRCTNCGDLLTQKTAKWLELSQTDGNYYADTFPSSHISQGAFPFGTSCATRQIQKTLAEITSINKQQKEAK